MQHYMTWEQYSSLYDDIPEAEFERQLARAEMQLDIVTHGRARRFEEDYIADIATPFQTRIHEQIKHTLCTLLNAIYGQENKGVADNITSVSNDGYSVSYKVRTASDKQEELMSIIRNGLSGTGLAGAL